MIFTELKQGDWFYFEFDFSPEYYAYIKTGDDSVIDLRTGVSYPLTPEGALYKEVHILKNVFSKPA